MHGFFLLFSVINAYSRIIRCYIIIFIHIISPTLISNAAYSWVYYNIGPPIHNLLFNAAPGLLARIPTYILQAVGIYD